MNVNMKNEDGITLMILIVTIVIILIIASVSIGSLVGGTSDTIVDQSIDTVNNYRVSEVLASLQSELAAWQYEQIKNGTNLTQTSLNTKIGEITRSYKDEAGWILTYASSTMKIKIKTQKSEDYYDIDVKRELLAPLSIDYDALEN